MSSRAADPTRAPASGAVGAPQQWRNIAPMRAARAAADAARLRAAAVAFEAAVRIVARADRLPAEHVRAPKGHSRAAWRARRTAVYLAVVGADQPAGTVARAAGIHIEAVRRTLADIEAAREQPALDRRLTTFEAVLGRQR